MATTAESTTLTNLSVDLLTTILSHLPTQDILRCRIVCPHLRDVIDEEGNRAPIYGPAIRRSAQRLLDEATPIISYGQEVPFAMVLKDFTRHRGVQADDELRMRDHTAFSRQWLLNRENYPVPWDRGQGFHANEIAGFARYFIMLHIQLHHPDLQVRWEGTRVPVDSEGFITSVAGEARSLLGLNATAVEALYVQTSRGLFSDAPILHADWNKGEHLPDWPLTATARQAPFPGEYHPYPKKISRQGGLCDVQQLQEMLGVDLVDLPSTRSFAYCVKTGWAYALVKDAVQSGLFESLDWKVRRMEWKVRAAILDRIYLY